MVVRQDRAIRGLSRCLGQVSRCDTRCLQCQLEGAHAPGNVSEPCFGLLNQPQSQSTAPRVAYSIRTSILTIRSDQKVTVNLFARLKLNRRKIPKILFDPAAFSHIDL